MQLLKDMRMLLGSVILKKRAKNETPKNIFTIFLGVSFFIGVRNC